MQLPGNCATTAMGVMPHTDPEQALKLALSLDIPFWPQLPRLSLYEDMYVQASEHFPGIQVDHQERVLRFDLARFYLELEEYLSHWEEPEYLSLSSQYSRVYHQFLNQDLGKYQAIRGQIIGPISFGLKIFDEEKRPIIYHTEVAQLLYDFMARKLQAQLTELQAYHDRSFVWIDEPGLELVFSAVTGYAAETALRDYRGFLDSLPRPHGVHLCGNPDWSFLLNLDLDILSLDAQRCGYIFSRYREQVVEFVKRGGIISWGMIPTLQEELATQAVEQLQSQLEGFWGYLADYGVSREQLAHQSWLAPARCCLINQDGGDTVAIAFAMVRELANRLKEKYHLV